MFPDSNTVEVLSIAVAAPLRRVFDYLPIPNHPSPQPGSRVKVPFGPSHRFGVVISHKQVIVDQLKHRLKPILEYLDSEPTFDNTLLSLLNWTADYYHHPIGDVFQSALPIRMRNGLPVLPAAPFFRLEYSMDKALEKTQPRALKQRLVIQTLASFQNVGLSRDELYSRIGNVRDPLLKLEATGIIRKFFPEQEFITQTGPNLNHHQQIAVDRVSTHFGHYQTLLLHGITGSGKTEVYLHSTQEALNRGCQVMILVPEISLTPQLVFRFRQRIKASMVVMHSGLSDGERQRAWDLGSSGKARVILGTRSAVFCKLPNLGLIIIDEEHDASFKQQEGFHYNARDVAIKRASMENFPVLLGSATPSIESWFNADTHRYEKLQLPDRAGNASLPVVHLVDMTRWPKHSGISPTVIDAISKRLERDEQSLVFLNRRGFAPIAMCSACSWQARCDRCDAFLTVHKNSGTMICHHCGSTRNFNNQCEECASTDIFLAGIGTQRVEALLQEKFPESNVMRIDRDNTTAKGELEQKLNDVREGKVDILVGTQLLSKGHDFPGITLVCVLNADQGMFSIDFRASERLFQSIVQVSGRAGRGSKAGEVLIQTDFVQHPCMQAIRQQDYHAFVETELQMRKQGELPPFRYQALLRAESVHQPAAFDFLNAWISAAQTYLHRDNEVEIMDPVSAPMERRAGKFRAQLLLQSHRRVHLNTLIHKTIKAMEKNAVSKHVRWRIDVDPIDLH